MGATRFIKIQESAQLWGFRRVFGSTHTTSDAFPGKSPQRCGLFRVRERRAIIRAQRQA